MTHACFYEACGVLTGFKIEGHAEFSNDDTDVLCAAISAMTGLVVNTVCEVFGAEIDFKSDEALPSIEMKIKKVPDVNDESVRGVLKGFILQLRDLADIYPNNLCVTVKQNITKGTKNYD